MKNKVILIAVIVVGVIVAGRALIVLRQPGVQDGGGDTVIDETVLEEYEDLKSHIFELIDDIDAEGLEPTGPDDALSIELFELDPENEELGEIH